MNKFLLALGALASVLTSNAQAQDFVVSYDGFYDRLKVMSKGDFASADVGFYLVNQKGNACDIESGKIITKTNEYPLNYTVESKLLLPFDETLDKDKALIVATPVNGEICQLKMQMESSIDYADSISFKQITALHQEFDTLMGKLSGFFMRTLFAFMMPEVKGITLLFAQPVSMPMGGNRDNINCSEMRCTVLAESLTEDGRFTFSQPIDKVIPYIAK